MLHLKQNKCHVFRYVRAEVMAGFVNGLFLVFIAFFIFSEAIEVSLNKIVTALSRSCQILITLRLVNCALQFSKVCLFI